MNKAVDYSEWAQGVPSSTGRPAMAAYALMATFLIVFGAWGIGAPLEGAAVASGVIAAAGKNIQVQHLEGGNIDQVLVREGDRVRAGAALYRLDRTSPQSQLNRLLKAKLSFEARATRLKAERDGKTSLVFSDALQKLTEFDSAQIVSEQNDDFLTGLRSYESEIKILQERMSALQGSVSGLLAQKKAAEDQFAIVTEEISRKDLLLQKGLTDRSQLSALMRDKAGLLGQIGVVTSEIAAIQTQIAEAALQIEQAKAKRIEEASKELTDIRRQETDFEEQIVAAKSALDRTVVAAPVDGIIVRLNINSKGSVVHPGETLLELLPTTNELIVEAKFDPKQVDSIHLKQQARLRFIALNARSTPEVSATVTFISPDRLVDTATGQSYYPVRLRIEKLPEEIAPDQVYPGMPVEAFITTEERTFAEYLIRPLIDSFKLAFREE